MRLIDADALKDNFKKTKIIEAFPNWKEMNQGTRIAVIRLTEKYREIILNAKTVDAVAVIRCEHCACNDRTDNDKRHGIVWCKKICRYMKADGFCSEVERRTDG